jgi:hypothetical protein
MFHIAHELVDRKADDHDSATLEAHGLPTCALAVVALAVGSWEDVARGRGRLVGVFRPPY